MNEFISNEIIADSVFVVTKKIDPIEEKVKIVLFGEGIDENEMPANFQIGPNPTNGIFFVNTASLKENYKAKVFDLNGKLILEQNFCNKTNFDISKHLSGVYHVIISDRNGKEMYSQKIIKE